MSQTNRVVGHMQASRSLRISGGLVSNSTNMVKKFLKRILNRTWTRKVQDCLVTIFHFNWNGLWLDDEKRLFKSFHLITRNAECRALSSQLRDISWRVSPADSSQLGSSPGASQAQAWAPSWVHSSVLSPGFVHPFIHQLTDDWAWQAWQYHHPTISNTQHWAHQTAYMASSLLWSVIGWNLKFP